MDKFAAIFAMLLCIIIGWMLGIKCSNIPENPNVTQTNSVIFKDCKDIKLDTISYNYRDSTYTIQVNIK